MFKKKNLKARKDEAIWAIKPELKPYNPVTLAFIGDFDLKVGSNQNYVKI